MIKRVALAILATPLVLVVISGFGLLCGAVGTVIHLALRDQTEIQSVAFRTLVLSSITLVSLVGTVGILNWCLNVAEDIGRRYPALRQAASDAILGLVGFGGVVGITFVGLAVLGIFPTGSLSLFVCGVILSVAAGAILLPRFFRKAGPLEPPGGEPPSGTLSTGIVRRSASSSADEVASGRAV